MFVQELQSHAVSVVGAVKMPGVFQIRGTKTVIEVLSMAQGLADDAGDTVLVMHGAGTAESEGLQRSRACAGQSFRAAGASRCFSHSIDSPEQAFLKRTAEIEEINLKKLLESADPALNVLVRPGDIVKVPRAGIVYVVGEVQKPGGFVLQNNENISVLQALALAQGATHTSGHKPDSNHSHGPGHGEANRNPDEPRQDIFRQGAGCVPAAQRHRFCA